MSLRLNKVLVGDIWFYEPVECADGFTMSIQASSRHLCSPRKDNLDEYDFYEVGFPSEEPLFFKEYAVDENYVRTVYGFVPKELILKEISYRGGIANY